MKESIRYLQNAEDSIISAISSRIIEMEMFGLLDYLDNPDYIFYVLKDYPEHCEDLVFLKQMYSVKENIGKIIDGLEEI